MVSSSVSTKVPGPSSKLDRQWMRTPWLRAYSTERSCSTPAPEAAISSISSNETMRQLARVGHDPRVGAEHAGDVGVDLAHVGVERGRERDRGGVRAAAAERRHVVRAGRRRPGSRRRARSCRRRAPARMRSARTSRIFALVCEVSVTMPGLRAGQRDRLVAEVVDHHRGERARDALAGREQHVHLARVRAVGDLVGHRRPARRWSCRARRARRRRGCRSSAARTIRSRGALDALGVGDGRAAELHHTVSACGRQVRHGRRRLALPLMRTIDRAAGGRGGSAVPDRRRRGDRRRAGRTRRLRRQGRVPEAGVARGRRAASLVPRPADPARARARRPRREGAALDRRARAPAAARAQGRAAAARRLQRTRPQRPGVPPPAAARPRRDRDRPPQLHRRRATRPSSPARPG